MTSGLSAQTYVADQGLLVIEIDSSTGSDQWSTRDALAGFTGQSYIQYDGPDLFNVPGRALVTYQVQLDLAGTYRFQWRSNIAIGDSNTEHNDSWLRVRGATDYYAQRSGSTVYSLLMLVDGDLR